VAHDKVVNFIEKYLEHSNTKKKDLLDSIEIARRQLSKAEAMVLDRKLARSGDAGGKKSGTTMGGALGESSSQLVQQKAGQPNNLQKPPSVTSKSTLANTKTASEMASELDCTKESMILLTGLGVPPLMVLPSLAELSSKHRIGT
jgi:hypothetical protein